MKICYEKSPSWVSGDFPGCFFPPGEIYEGSFNDFEEQIHVVGYVEGPPLGLVREKSSCRLGEHVSAIRAQISYSTNHKC